jgi:hypothetical protein
VTWYTADTMRRYLEVAVDNCARLRDGTDLVNLVNEVPVDRPRPPGYPQSQPNG